MGQPMADDSVKAQQWQFHIRRFVSMAESPHHFEIFMIPLLMGDRDAPVCDAAMGGGVRYL